MQIKAVDGSHLVRQSVTHIQYVYRTTHIWHVCMIVTHTITP